jgi:hypothetical protein
MDLVLLQENRADYRLKDGKVANLATLPSWPSPIWQEGELCQIINQTASSIEPLFWIIIGNGAAIG